MTLPLTPHTDKNKNKKYTLDVVSVNRVTQKHSMVANTSALWLADSGSWGSFSLYDDMGDEADAEGLDYDERFDLNIVEVDDE